MRYPLPRIHCTDQVGHGRSKSRLVLRDGKSDGRDTAPDRARRAPDADTAASQLARASVSMIPVVTTTETLAVIRLTRTARTLDHPQIQRSPRWITRAVSILIAMLGVALGFATCVQIPTYSTGTAVVLFEDSSPVTATAGGTVEQVLVRENEPVEEGDPLVRLASPEATADLAAAESELRDARARAVFDQTDGQVRASLAHAVQRRDHARAVLAARTMRAPRNGLVTHLHVQRGATVQPGSYLLQITDETSATQVLAFLPSRDRPRLHNGLELELELDGYAGSRVLGTITDAQPDEVSGGEAVRLAGDTLAESLAKELSAGTWAVVRGQLPSSKFKTPNDSYRYHHGMHAKADVKIDSRPFIATLLPAIGDYVFN